MAKKIKLSKAQQIALDKMKNGNWYSSYGLGASLSTMGALYRKGLVEKVDGLGAFSSPQTGIKYRIVETK